MPFQSTIPAPAGPGNCTVHPVSFRGLAASRGRPLLRLQAHWQVPAHRRYLEAASFTWQR
jgi:hypothetical protein